MPFGKGKQKPWNNHIEKRLDFPFGPLMTIMMMKIVIMKIIVMIVIMMIIKLKNDTDNNKKDYGLVEKIIMTSDDYNDNDNNDNDIDTNIDSNNDNNKNNDWPSIWRILKLRIDRLIGHAD